MPGQLTGRTCIVTGASSGIGRAIALGFAREGAIVIIADPRAHPVEGGAPTVELIRSEGGAAHYHALDVADAAAVEALVSEVAARQGRLDVLVNNAATWTSTALTETTPEQWEAVLRVNLGGYFNGCRSAVRQMRQQAPLGETRGRIINIASQHGTVACPGDPAYGVSKAGAIHLTRQVAADHARDLIVCNCISPGKIMTGAPGIAQDPQRLEYARLRTPWPRFGRPEDIANAAVFLASERATFITGANLAVDGGWLAA